MTLKEAWNGLLERIKNYAEIFEDKEEQQVILKELDIIRPYLTTPTKDEVCKALSEYESYFGKVNYDASTRRFYSEDTICYLGIDYQRTPIIIFEYDLPPHLITMIGKFYESLEGEK